MPLSPPNQTNLIRRYYANGKSPDGSKGRHTDIYATSGARSACSIEFWRCSNLGIANVQLYRLRWIYTQKKKG